MTQAPMPESPFPASDFRARPADVPAVAASGALLHASDALKTSFKCKLSVNFRATDYGDRCVTPLMFLGGGVAWVADDRTQRREGGRVVATIWPSGWLVPTVAVALIAPPMDALCPI